jgi:hypothetical protein
VNLELSVIATRNSETPDTTKTSIFQQRFSQCTDIQLYSTINVCTPDKLVQRKLDGLNMTEPGFFFTMLSLEEKSETSYCA